MWLNWNLIHCTDLWYSKRRSLYFYASKRTILVKTCSSSAIFAELHVKHRLSKVWCPTNHTIGHIGDRFLWVKWPNQQCQST